MRATSRMTGAARNTIMSLLADMGQACMAHHDRTFRGLTSERVEIDEIWAFVGCKEQHLAKHTSDTSGKGDVWTWVAQDADSKFCISYALGPRDASSAQLFLRDVASRLKNRVQLSTDGLHVYYRSVIDAFGTDVDYSMLIKRYGRDVGGEKLYSPPVCIGCSKQRVIGNPKPEKVSTSYVERQNLTMRMSMRRFTRLTNAFSKKFENHEAAVALHFAYYNLCRVHMTLKTTPAVAMGVMDHVWSVEELVSLLESN